MYKTLKTYNNNNPIYNNTIDPKERIEYFSSKNESKWGNANQLFKNNCGMSENNFIKKIWSSKTNKKFPFCKKRDIPNWAMPLHNPYKRVFKNYNIPQKKKFKHYNIEVLSPKSFKEDFNIITNPQNKRLLINLFGDNWPQSTNKKEDLDDLCWHFNSFTQKRSFSWIIRNKSNKYAGCAYYFPILNPVNDKIDNAQVYIWFSATYQINQVTMTEFYREFIHWLNSPEWPKIKLQIFTPQNRNSDTGKI